MINSILESMNNYIPTDSVILKELNDIPDINEDPMEFVIRVAYENEMNMMKLDQAIIAEEYIYLRENNDDDKIPLSERIKVIFQSIKKFLDTVWQKVQMFFKSVFNKFIEELELDDKFLKKYKEKAKGKKSGKINAPVVYFYHYLTILDRVEDTFSKLSAEGEDFINSILRRIKNEDDIYGIDTVRAIVDADKRSKYIFNITKDKFIKNISKSLGVDDINKKIIAEKLSANDAINILENAQKDKNELKKFYTITKSQLNTCKAYATRAYRDIINQIKHIRRTKPENRKYDAYLCDLASVVKRHSTLASNMCVMLNNFGVGAINKGRQIAKAVIISSIKNDTTSSSTDDSNFDGTTYRVQRSEKDYNGPRDPIGDPVESILDDEE